MTVARSPPSHCLKLYRHIVNQTRKNRICNTMWIKIQQYNNLFSNAWFGGLHKNTICCQDRTKIKHNAGLTHWGRVTHICVSKLTIIGSDNGLSHGQRQAIIWTSGGMLFIRTLGKSLGGGGWTRFKACWTSLLKCGSQTAACVFHSVHNRAYQWYIGSLIQLRRTASQISPQKAECWACFISNTIYM